MFHIAVCDDNPAEAGTILSLLADFQEARPGISFHIQSFDSGHKLLESLEAKQTYDLYLLDVLMPCMTGLELAEKLRINNPDVPLIFLTSSPDYALSAYNVSAVQYILKPVAEDKLFSAFDKILAFRKLEKDDFFAFQSPERALKISYSAIVYIEVTGHVMKVRLDNGDTISSKRMNVPFQTAIAPLLEDSRFLYAHKSYLINMDFVQELKGNNFLMNGGFMLPIPKYKVSKAKDTYFKYLSQYGFGRFGGDA